MSTAARVAPYRFRETIRVRRVNGKVLLWDPPTGSWCFLKERYLEIIEALKGIVDDMRWSELTAEYIKILDDLYEKGLVAKEGQFSWKQDWFDHHKNRVNTLILKVVGYCNLGCTYCYDYNQVRYKKSMSPTMAMAAIDQVWPRAGDLLNVLFHGGEPMLAKELIFEIVPKIHQKGVETGKQVMFSIQSNGTMFDTAWVELFEAYPFSVGVSLDGPQDANDEHRVTHDGRGTYNRIVDLLKRHPGLLEKTGILTTVTRSNVKHLLDIALHFQDLGVRCWDVSLFQSAGRGAGREDQFEPDAAALVDAYLQLLDGIELGRFPTMEVRCVAKYVRNVLGYDRSSMCLRTSCGAGSDLVSISVDGTIEACDCIVNPDLSLGRLAQGRPHGSAAGAGKEATIGAALDSPRAAAIRSRHVDSLVPCRDCDWKVVCGGSCLAKAGSLTAVDATECALSMALFPAILESLCRSNAVQDHVERAS